MQSTLSEMGVPPAFPDNDPARQVFTNRTINLRAVQAIGFDMDYTLIQYDVAAWEGIAYQYGLRSLAKTGFPVDGLEFDESIALRGLVVDVQVRRVCHHCNACALSSAACFPAMGAHGTSSPPLATRAG